MHSVTHHILKHFLTLLPYTYNILIHFCTFMINLLQSHPFLVQSYYIHLTLCYTLLHSNTSIIILDLPLTCTANLQISYISERKLQALNFRAFTQTLADTNLDCKNHKIRWPDWEEMVILIMKIPFITCQICVFRVYCK